MNLNMSPNSPVSELVANAFRRLQVHLTGDEGGRKFAQETSNRGFLLGNLQRIQNLDADLRRCVALGILYGLNKDSGTPRLASRQ